MRVTHEYNAKHKPESFKSNLFDGEIATGYQLQIIERTASGGYSFTSVNEDEFGNESKVQIVLEALDVATIKELIEKDLL